MIPAIEYIERFLYIKTKEGELTLLKLNVMQKKFYDIIKAQFQAGKPVRIIVLKARQLGFSTFIEKFFILVSPAPPFGYRELPVPSVFLPKASVRSRKFRSCFVRCSCV